MTPPTDTPRTKVPVTQEAVPTKTFISVLVLEAVIVVLLWLFGRAYS